MSESMAVGVFIANYTIDNSPSLINLIDLLSRKGRVDVHLLRVVHTTNPVLKRKTVRVLDYSKSPGDWAAHRCLSERYDAYIGVDPHGFAMCKELFPNARPVYYSLELYMSYDYAGLDYPAAVRDRERSWIHDAAGLIIQSEEKAGLFRDDYGLAGSVPAFILPVTYQGPADRQKGDLIRRHYDIPADRSIALHLGGIAPWFSCAEIAGVFSGLSDWVLFFQGYADKVYARELQQVLSQKGVDNVILTDRVYDRLEEVDEVIRSCDVGIAWYNDISIGFRTAGQSSGKIPGYMRFGLPVVAKAYPSTRAAIADTGAGLCIDDYLKIPEALANIRADYEGYSVRAMAEYEHTYRFENYEDRLIEFICGKPASSHNLRNTVSPEEQLKNDSHQAAGDGMETALKQVQRHPDAGEAWVDLAVCFWYAGDFQRAWAALEGAERLGAAGWRTDWYRMLVIRDDDCNWGWQRYELGQASAARVLASLPEFGPAVAFRDYFGGNYAQWGQDVLAEDFFKFNAPRSRTFVDVGAFDGVHFSNTRRFAQAGWGGLCIEPDSENFANLNSLYPNGSVRCIRKTVGLREGKPLLARGDTGSRPVEKSVENTETVCVERLDTILDEAGVDDVDFLSINAGGRNFDVIESINFSRRRPQLVVVEYNGEPEDRKRMSAWMSEMKYLLWHDNVKDLFFRDAATIEPPNFWRIRTPLPQRPDPDRQGTLSHHFNWDRLMENRNVDDFLASDELWGANQDAANRGRKAWRQFLSDQAAKGRIKVLEIGFGSGIDYLAAEKEGLLDSDRIEYHGADVTRTFIENARSRFRRMTVHHIDGYELPFENDSFDVVYLRHVFEHQIHYKWLLDEVLRVCRRHVFVNFFIPLSGRESDTISFDGTWYHNNYSKQRFLDFVADRSFAVREMERFQDGDKTDQLILLTAAKEAAATHATDGWALPKPQGKKSLQIVHTVEYYHPHVGGAELVVQQISERLARRGHRVTVATTALAVREKDQINGVTVEGFAVKGKMGSRIAGPDVDRYREFILKSEADVVMNYAAQQWATDLAFETLPATAGRRVNVIAPCGYSALDGPHTLRWPDFADYFQKVIPRCLPQYDAAVYHSAGYQDYAFALDHGFSNSVVIPNGVDTDEFDRPSKVDFREKYGISTRYFGLCVANYLPDKGQDLVINCMKEMERDDFSLVFIGKLGSELDRLRRMADGMAVRFLQDIIRADTVAAFHAADIFLFGSRIEAAPLVIIEAMAAHTPFVSTDCGNVSEMKGGVVCAPREMARNANRLLDNPSLRTALAREGNRQVRESLNWESVVDRYEDLYLRLLHTKKQGTRIGLVPAGWRQRLCELDRRIDAETGTVDLYLNAARLLLDADQKTEARKYIEDALELAPDHPEACSLYRKAEVKP